MKYSKRYDVKSRDVQAVVRLVLPKDLAIQAVNAGGFLDYFTLIVRFLISGWRAVQTYKIFTEAIRKFRLGRMIPTKQSHGLLFSVERTSVCKHVATSLWPI